MGLGGISIWQLLIVLGIVVVIFGTGKLRSIGGDLGGAIKSFRKAMNEGEAAAGAADKEQDTPKLEADPEPETTSASGAQAERRSDSVS
jgi:sec-independent protein translocase protein TatA